MLWKIFEAIWDTTTEPTRVMKEYLTPIVRRAVEEKQRDSKDGVNEAETLLSHLVSSSDGKVLPYILELIVNSEHRCGDGSGRIAQHIDSGKGHGMY